MIEVVRLLMPVTWLAAAVAAITPVRFSTELQVSAFFLSAFTTRLAIEHVESRYQIAGFVGAAAVLELAFGRRDHAGLSRWLAVSLAAAAGVIVARPIAHHGMFGL